MGAYRAGFKVAVAVENDPYALSTHIKNFPLTVHMDRDISLLEGKAIRQSGKLTEATQIGIIGGPPCQGFSNIGVQNKDDIRNNLFGHFFRIVDEMSPLFFLAENVPNILSEKYDHIRNSAFKAVSDEYDLLPPLRLTASDYGAPTSRTRIFFIGFKKGIVDLENIETVFSPSDIPKVFVKDALRGLPRKINPEWQSEKDGWRKTYPMPESRYAKKIIGEIPHGVGCEDAVNKYLKTGKVSGCLGTRHSSEVADRYARVKQGGMDKISKSQKLKPNGFCPTLRAGTGRDKGSYQAVRPLHPSQGRVITPREAARLQGFPDWFVFHNTKWHSFRQIGNSVSPLVAEYLLKKIRGIIERSN